MQDAFVIALRRIGDLRDRPPRGRGWSRSSSTCAARAAPAAARIRARADGDPPRPRPLRGDRRSALRDWVWTALERLSEPLRLAVMLRYFTGRELVRGDRRRLRRSGRHGAQPPERRKRHWPRSCSRPPPRRTPTRCHRRRASRSAMPTALRAQRRRAARSTACSPRRRFRDGRSRRAARRARLAEALARDFEDGVRARLGKSSPAARSRSSNCGSTTRPSSRCTARPAVTQIHFHPTALPRGSSRTTRRVLSRRRETLPSARSAAQAPNQRARRLEPKCSFSATSAADGALKLPVRVGPERKSMSTRPTRPLPNSM